MLRMFLSLTVLALLVPSVSAQDVPPHQIGLIDLAHVFKNYKKFTAMTEALQQEIAETDGDAKSMIEQIQQYQSQLTSGNLQEGSPDFVRIEGQMLQAQTNLETFRKVAQRDFLRKEADIYKTVYLEVEDAVRQYAQFYKYTLILRFNREQLGQAEDPRAIINGMNRQVVFFRNQDDLTDPILSYLNEQWQQRQTATGIPNSSTK